MQDSKMNSLREQEISQLLKELEEREDTYDIRFWPNKEITRKTIEMIAKKKFPNGFNALYLSRTVYLIERIVELGGTIESIYSALSPNIKEQCRRKAGYWEQGIQSYKAKIQEAMEQQDRFEVKRLSKLAMRSYEEYLLFCKFAQTEPQETQNFISEAEAHLETCRDDKENNKANSEDKTGKDNTDTNFDYLGRFPEKPATDKQINLLRNLSSQKSFTINQDITKLTRKEASQLISQLLNR